MSQTYTYTFPSGLRATFRGWTFPELPSDSTDDTTAILNLLNLCTVSVENYGPYEPGEPFDWSQLLVAERQLALCAMRVALGVPELKIDYRCPAKVQDKNGEPKTCGSVMVVPPPPGITALPSAPVIDLRDVIEYGVCDLPDETVENIRTKNRFAVNVDGLDIEFRLMQLGDINKVQRFQKQHRCEKDSEKFAAYAAYCFYRIGDAEGPAQVYEYCRNLPGDQAYIYKIPDEWAPQVDNTIELRCSSAKCSAEVTIPLPLDHPEFWTPSPKSGIKAPAQKRRPRPA